MDQKGAASEPAPETKIQFLNKMADDVTDTGKKVLKAILDRGENMDETHEKAKALEQQAQDFKMTSDEVARSYWWKNVKLIVAIVVVVLIIVLIIIILLATGVIPVSSPLPPIPPPSPEHIATHT